MSEDLTQKLPDSRPFEERVLAELAAIRSGQAAIETRLAALEDQVTKFETRLTALEEKVDARLRETRPIWENMQQQLTEMQTRMSALETRMAAMEKTLDDIRLQLTELYRDSFEIRGRIGRLEERERLSAG